MSEFAEIPSKPPHSVLPGFDAATAKKLGQGKYGVVYRAVYLDGRPVAVKVISKQLTKAHPEFCVQLAHEVAVLRQSRHKHIVSYIDGFQDSHNVYIVMELIEGGELFDFIIQRKHLNEAETAEFVRQILSALHYLHDNLGAVHRDIKPENVMVHVPDKTKPDLVELKLTDFGFVKFVGVANHDDPYSPSTANAPHSAQLTATPFKGTARYMAPEALQWIVRSHNAPRATTRSALKKVDVFSVGVLTYIMLCGRFPFRGDDRTKAQLLASINSGMTFVETQWKTVSTQAKDFCTRLTNCDRAHRPSAREALNHPWLVMVAPQTPLELPQKDDGFKTMNEAMREEETELDNAQEVLDGVDPLQAIIDATERSAVGAAAQAAPRAAVIPLGPVPKISRPRRTTPTATSASGSESSNSPVLPGTVTTA